MIDPCRNDEGADACRAAALESRCEPGYAVVGAAVFAAVRA